jgi:hypothetical protein
MLRTLQTGWLKAEFCIGVKCYISDETIAWRWFFYFGRRNLIGSLTTKFFPSGFLAVQGIVIVELL